MCAMQCTFWDQFNTLLFLMVIVGSPLEQKTYWLTCHSPWPREQCDSDPTSKIPNRLPIPIVLFITATCPAGEIIVSVPWSATDVSDLQCAYRLMQFWLHFEVGGYTLQFPNDYGNSSVTAVICWRRQRLHSVADCFVQNYLVRVVVYGGYCPSRICFCSCA